MLVMSWQRCKPCLTFSVTGLRPPSSFPLSSPSVKEVKNNNNDDDNKKRKNFKIRSQIVPKYISPDNYWMGLSERIQVNCSHLTAHFPRTRMRAFHGLLTKAHQP